MTGVMLISILFFGPLANIVRVEHILLASSAMLASVGAIFGLSERVNPQA